MLLSKKVHGSIIYDMKKQIGIKFGVNNGQISSKNVLLVECLKRPGVESMAFRTNPFFTGNEFSEKKHTLLH